MSTSGELTPTTPPETLFELLLEPQWTLVTPNGERVTCAIYRVVASPGVKVRAVRHGVRRRTHRIHVADIDRGRQVAQIWRRAFLGHGLVE